MKEIHNYNDFVEDLYEVGMTMGGENNEKVFSLCGYFGPEIEWHIEQQDVEPWEWRMRVLNEYEDIAYGKLFFNKSGYITREWFPYFYKIRRGNKDLYEEYEIGNISSEAKRIYDLLNEYKELPMHLIKERGGFTRDEKSRFDKAMTELQMKFYISMCGKARKVSKAGDEYGWSSTVFCMTDDFFTDNIAIEADKLSYEEAYSRIEEHIYSLNPEAVPARVRKFIVG